MSQKLIHPRGYLITVESDENDGDNENTKELHADSYNGVQYALAAIKAMRPFENEYEPKQYVVNELQKDLSKVEDDFRYEANRMPAEDLLYNLGLMCCSDFYTRSIRRITVTYSDKDIFVSIVEDGIV